MSLLLRAALVVGLLTFLAMRQEGHDPTRRSGELPFAMVDVPGIGMDALVRAAAEGRIQGIAGAALSRDTLLRVDRQPAWRGASRESAARGTGVGNDERIGR